MVQWRAGLKVAMREGPRQCDGRNYNLYIRLGRKLNPFGGNSNITSTEDDRYCGS